MTPLQTFCAQALRAIHADGFVDTDLECGCTLQDFASCGDGPYSECQPAIQLIIPEDGNLIDPQTGEPVLYSEGNPGDFIMVPFVADHAWPE